ncbi:MAG: precorrin-2 C(20)-methyltransferase [Lachnospiraceae bacterium]|nr:precorrin-2 C(20)-methyltransferase [Lachnospiraceae bacterium]
MKGKLYGIGVGPGDPSLLTMKAKEIIESADIVAVPVKKIGEASVALEIAKKAVDIPKSKIREIEFTMNKDKAKREECRKNAAKEVMALLDEDNTIAMLTLGDIGIYSTYAYVHKIIVDAGYDVEMVSGIPSFCAGASKAGISLAEGNEGLGVIPSLKGIDQVAKALDVFDNLVIMKVGNHVDEVCDLLKERGLFENGVVVSNVGMEDEYVGPLIADRAYGYFTTIIVKKNL